GRERQPARWPNVGGRVGHGFRPVKQESYNRADPITRAMDRRFASPIRGAPQLSEGVAQRPGRMTSGRAGARAGANSSSSMRATTSGSVTRPDNANRSGIAN